MNQRSQILLRVGLFSASILTIFLRRPDFFLEPRLWAEEGQIYFAYACTHPWYVSLFNIQLGYLALWPNIATTVAANFVSLLYVPLFTTLFAFVVQLVPVVLILWSDSDLWSHPAKIVAGVLTILFAPLSNEVWLNTINSQFYFAVVTFLILLIEIDVRPLGKWSSRVLLALAGLTGPISCILFPLFFLKARWEKKQERVIQTYILAACFAVQLVAFLTMRGSSTSPARALMLNLPLFISVLWTQDIGLLLFGIANMTELAQFIEASRTNGLILGFIVFSLLVAEGLFFLLVSSRLTVSQRIVFAGSFFLFVGLSVVGGLGIESFKYLLLFPGNGGRYFYAPNVVLMFFLLANSQWQGKAFNKVRSGTCIVLLGIALILGMAQYQYPMRFTDTGPNWKEEVAKWERDPAYAIRIWPVGWQIEIPHQHK